MQKFGSMFLALILLFSASSAKAEGFYVPAGVQGLVTGALLGSVFGPDKKVRGKNAIIGAVSGYIIGTQYAKPRESGSSWPSRQQITESSFYPQHNQQTIIIDRSPHRRNWQETRTIYTSPSYGSQTIIIERQSPVKYHKKNRRHRRHWH
ncbi:MAG: hypothetical protein HQL70_03530 [Magnetococcales bacterium]|nr:hypothetical protein [Magnetococcales bacterium]